MKKLLLIVFLSLLVGSCASNNEAEMAVELEENIDTIKIANDSLKYELVFIEEGFYDWMKAEAQPRSTFSQEYLEEMNFKMIDTYNFRCQDKYLYADLYPKPIHYDTRVDYGFEFNYLLYNYLLFFQKRYRQNL